VASDPLKTHPYRKTATRQLVGGLVLAAIALLVMLGGGMFLVVGVTFAAIGAAIAYFGAYSRRQTAAVVVNNAAVDLIGRGKIAEAEALLATVPLKSGNVRRAVGLQRAMIALRRADAPAAEALAAEVIAAPMDLLTKDAEVVQNVTALAIRALARATVGKEHEAFEDIRAVRSSDDALPDALARAAVAEATLHAKRDDREALARCLRESAPLLEHTAVRERALLRAFRRMLQAEAGSVYREAARPDEAAREEPLIGEWVAKIVPRAAAFVPEAEHLPQTGTIDANAPDSLPVAAGSAVIAREATSRAGKRRVWLTLVLCAVLSFMFAAIWQFLSPVQRPDAIAAPPVEGAPSAMPLGCGLLLTAVCVLLVPFFAGRIYAEVVRNRRGAAALRQAMRALAAGDIETCSRLLSALVPNAPTASRQPRSSSSACSRSDAAT
jgi:hypothetical protein